MTARQFTADELAELRSLAAQWGKIVSKRTFGDDGPGLDVDFRTMEQIAAVAAEGLTEGTLQHLLEQQAKRLPKEQSCPECGKLCPTEPLTRCLPLGEPRSSKSNRCCTVPAVAGLCGWRWDSMNTPTALSSSNKSSPPPRDFPCFVTPLMRSKCRRSISAKVRFGACHELGQELIAERDRKVIEHRRRQLAARTSVIPEAVVAEVDGGRIRTRAADSAPGVHDAQNKEDKVACLTTLSSTTFASDPQPEPPESFRCPRRIQRLVQQMKGQAVKRTSRNSWTNRPIPRPRGLRSKRRHVGRRSGWFGRAWQVWKRVLRSVR